MLSGWLAPVDKASEFSNVIIYIDNTREELECLPQITSIYSVVRDVPDYLDWQFIGGAVLPKLARKPKTPKLLCDHLPNLPENFCPS